MGTDAFKKAYVAKKIEKWIDDVKELSKIAVTEPQIALSAFTKGICHRWSLIQRTVGDIGYLFLPLEECIREHLIPSIVGRNVSDTERKILALPVRYGGLGISDPSKTAEREYHASVVITEDLTGLLYQQEQDLSLFDAERQQLLIKELKASKESIISNDLNIICNQTDVSPTLKRALELNKQKGSGTWLTVLPLQDLGFCLNKREFRDALCLRYGWNVPGMPPFCGCGHRNSIDHTLICKKGGYVAMRHNNLRDLNSELMKEVCRDVVTEPQMITLDDEDIQGTKADKAAPDISSRGLWSTFERTFFDVRVLHPNCPSYVNKDMNKIYQAHENEKMKKYNERVLTVERGSFTPLVYTTFGGWGPQATRYHKRLAEKISSKRNEDYSHVLSHMRARVRFSLLRSTLVAVRGERGKRQPAARPLASTSFNLIPDMQDYESF